MKIGIIGIGQCGSNICEVAELTNNYRTAIANTSQIDLDSIKLITNKILLGNNGGAGKNRDLAKSDAKKNYKKIIDLINNKFQDIEMIYFAFSSGGGTGSGMTPMLIDVVRRVIPEKKFGAITVLPFNNESLVAQINAYKCFSELIKLEIPCFLVDNQKVIKKFPHASRKELLDKANQFIIDSFELLLNNEREATKYGALDDRDLTILLSTPGCTNVTTTNIYNIKEEKDERTFGKKILDSINNSSFYPSLEMDGVVSRMGFMYELSDNYTRNVSYDELKEELGEPLGGIFDGYYKNTDKEHQLVISILTGLSYPIKRLEEIKSIIDKKKNTSGKEINRNLNDIDLDWYSESISKSLPPMLADEDDDISDSETGKATKRLKKELDIQSILDSY